MKGVLKNTLLVGLVATLMSACTTMKTIDVRETKAGDYYLTITESKKFTNEDGTFYYKKHKIYLYKEDFAEFNSSLKETCDYIIENKGTEVISEKHDKDFDSKKEKEKDESGESVSTDEEKDFADVDFENDDQ